MTYLANVRFDFLADGLCMLSRFFCNHRQILNFILIIPLQVFECFAKRDDHFGQILRDVRHGRMSVRLFLESWVRRLVATTLWDMDEEAEEFDSWATSKKAEQRKKGEMALLN